MSVFYDIKEIGLFDGNTFEGAFALNNGFTRYPVSFWAKKDNIVPYFDFSFDNVKKDFVKEIVLGPKCKVNEKDLALFLTVNGFDTETIKIFHSKCSYR